MISSARPCGWGSPGPLGTDLPRAACSLSCGLLWSVGSGYPSLRCGGPLAGSTLIKVSIAGRAIPRSPRYSRQSTHLCLHRAIRCGAMGVLSPQLNPWAVMAVTLGTDLQPATADGVSG